GPGSRRTRRGSRGFDAAEPRAVRPWAFPFPTGFLDPALPICKATGTRTNISPGAAMNALTDFFTNDWYFAVPMSIMAFVAFLLVAWRWLLNQSAKSNVDDLLPDLQATLRKQGTKG